MLVLIVQMKNVDALNTTQKPKIILYSIFLGEKKTIITAQDVQKKLSILTIFFFQNGATKRAFICCILLGVSSLSNQTSFNILTGQFLHPVLLLFCSC